MSLVAEDLYKRFGPIEAVAGVSFAVAPGFPTVALLAAALLFGVIAVLRFDWDEA